MSQCINPDCLHRNPPKEQFCERCGEKLLLRERYRAIQPLSAGSFGKTFVAIDEDKPSRSYCVIKQFLPKAQDRFSMEKGSVLFEREAQQLDELGKHPQIPELLAYFTEGNYKYLIQEYISGLELRKEQETFGVFNEKKLLKFLYEILSILEFIHNRHIIHRDIKPENIIRRSRDRKLVLVDFGAVKDLKGLRIAPAGTIIGSTGYTAPEQWQGKATVASDLYSVGATSIYLLTGIQPGDLFDYLENQWIWRKKLGVNTISEGLSRILDRLLALPLSQRYTSVEEVLTDWHALDNTSLDLLEEEDDLEQPLELHSHPTDQQDLAAFCFLTDQKQIISPSNETEGSEIETSFFSDADVSNAQEDGPIEINQIHPSLRRLLNVRKPVHPTLKKLLNDRDPDYIRVDIQVNSALKIIEHSENAGYFATSPELIQVGVDARRGFPELVGLEKIAAEIRQGQRQSLELKEISREQEANTPLYFDLYFTCDPGESQSENMLMILIIEATEAVSEEENFTPSFDRSLTLEQGQAALVNQQDPLTKLPNREAFEDYLYEEWRHLKRQQRSLALILCDLDYFEQYNETYGYAAGDQCLQKVAKILQSVVRRQADMIARFESQQFALILPDTENEGALSVAESLSQELANSKLPNDGAGRRGVITLSCGVASLIPSNELHPKTLIQNADHALRQAKEQGRDRAVLFQDQN
ncbi:diguanylate cyclase [Halothece sp. PCC 7418]|uniref:diguanylate cyclase domain-containing protein n=1 Tax=Halothece sp. (strain PCC 7418) TaxID=65093 RepID=UPI0002A07622|nr:diguanylate cyclase [Halothece sp. PCC 7418]AFZ43771.1 diguanylate cyclase [Halothece sp. PCC 7418]